MGNYGIKIGSNLNTNTDLELKHTTKFSSLKLYKWKNAQFTTDGSGVGSTTVTHDLGYTPIVQVWGKHTSQFSFLSATSYSDTYSLLDSINSYRPYSAGIEFFPDEDKITIKTLSIGGYGGGASPNTTYYFRVLIWVDKSEDFSGTSTISLDDDYGFKSSESGVSVLTGQEYQMQYSSKYRGIQYYDGHIKNSSLTLPAMWASRYDTDVQEAVYVDFNHNLGYPPLFFFYSDLGTSYQQECPYFDPEVVGPSYSGLVEVSAWCDSSRVRVLFHRRSICLTGETSGTIYPETTISVSAIITTENLSRTEN